MNLFKKNQLIAIFQRWLLLYVLIAFCITGAFTFMLQHRISEENTNELLALNIRDVVADVSDASDENLLALTHTVVQELEHTSDLNAIAEKHGIAEINVIDANGMITASTNRDFLGFDMASGEQSGAFMVLLNDSTEYVQSYQPISYDAGISRKYAGVALDQGGFVQIGYDAVQFQQDIDNQVIGATRNRHVGQNGYILITNEEFRIVSDSHDHEGMLLSETGIHLDPAAMPQGEQFVSTVYGEPCCCMYQFSEGYYIISVLPEHEAVFTRNFSIFVTVLMEIFVFVALFLAIYFLIRRLVVNNIHKVNESLAQITDGNLDVVVDVRDNDEFAALSDDINATVSTLKQYIDEAEARIDQELALAQSIQYSALPSTFPPYPKRKDFDIYAMMRTAKEVGGDFYDFYFIRNNKFAFLIADVSGKGIPAAMFMMKAKSVIKGYAESGTEVHEIFNRANEELCANNDANMFVTAWLGIIDLKTGLIEYANAGHNPPVVKHQDGSFTYLKSRPGFVLAGMEGITYQKQELQLMPGDEIYLYTDGVTEAMNERNELYGEERLCSVLNVSDAATAIEVCEAVNADVLQFVGEAAQFDDITMLSLKYKGVNPT